MSIVRIDGSVADVARADRSAEIVELYSRGSEKRAKHVLVWKLRKLERWPPTDVQIVARVSKGHIRRLVLQVERWLLQNFRHARAEAA